MQIHAYALARRAQLRAEFRRFGMHPVDTSAPDWTQHAARRPGRSPALVPVDILEVSAVGRLAALRSGAWD